MMAMHGSSSHPGSLTLERLFEIGDISLRCSDGRCVKAIKSFIIVASSVIRALFEDMESTTASSSMPNRDHDDRSLDHAAKRRKGDGQQVVEVPVSEEMKGQAMQGFGH